jgi:hypothetical protein
MQVTASAQRVKSEKTIRRIKAICIMGKEINKRPIPNDQVFSITLAYLIELNDTFSEIVAGKVDPIPVLSLATHGGV